MPGRGANDCIPPDAKTPDRPTPSSPLPTRHAAAGCGDEGRDGAEMAARRLGPPRLPARLRRWALRERPQPLAHARPSFPNQPPALGHDRRRRIRRRYRSCVISLSRGRRRCPGPSRRGGRASARRPSSSRCGRACARCRGRCAARRRSPAPSRRARSAVRSRARARTGRRGSASASAARRKLDPQRDVLSATNSTSRCPVTTSVWPAHCTATVLPSARIISASPWKWPAARAAAHCAGDISGPPTTNSATGRPITSSRAWPSRRRKAGFTSTCRRCSSTSAIGFLDCLNAAENSAGQPSRAMRASLRPG